MKCKFKILCCFLICFSCFFVSCKKEISLQKKSLRIVTTIFPQYDFVRSIGGEKVNVSMLLKPGAESHSFEPTPKDIKSIQNADLFICLGGENDVWVKDIILSMGDKAPKVIEICNLVEGIEVEHHHGEEAVSDHGHNHTFDEHVWTSPLNAILIVNAICNEMCTLDSENQNYYKANAEKYKQDLILLDKDFRNLVNNSKRKTLVFGDRFPFRYFAKEYGLTFHAAFSGCSTETEVSPQTIANLINVVKAESIPVVFTIEFSNGKIADSIVDATGAQKCEMHSCHVLSDDDLKNGENYISIMRRNLLVLEKALN